MLAGLYHGVATYLRVGGDEGYLFHMSAGILQGCPMSGFLLAAVLDATLRAMDTALARRRFGMVRACDDDLGAVARRKEALLRLRQPFAVARAAVGLPTSANCLFLGRPSAQGSPCGSRNGFLLSLSFRGVRG